MSRTKEHHSYHDRMSTVKAGEIYTRVVKSLTQGKRYRDPDLTAQKLAEEIGTNSRYISSAIALAGGGNFRTLVNGMRLRDACRMMTQENYRDTSLEDIGYLVGYCSRQAFHLAFRRTFDCSPAEFRKRHHTS